MKKDILQERRKAQLKAKRLRSTLIIGGTVLLIGSFLGLLTWNNIKPLAGEEVPHLEDATEHVAEGSDPGPYSSNPPTSGRHYDIPLPAGFYDEDNPLLQSPYPEGYLLHNLEHGYIVFWYNCAVLDAGSCTNLKSQIRSMIDDFQENKLIGFPWPDMDTPLAIASWGQLQEFDSFDEDAARAFIKTNRNQAPEPNTP
ncbi:MAG: DUF3105 domain-containing protein [Chloroflexi bacterium]|nr:DUF3105 domain-containing protein [Chloroflexota bacterium]